MFQAIADLDPAATLARAQAAIGQRRAAEIEDLLLIAHWADLRGDEPTPPTKGREWHGEDRLVEIGGDGTPQVRELSLSELAIARGCHTLAVRAAMADVLDLRHRLPKAWQVFLAGDCDAWVVRKIAAMSRRLDRHQVALVDAAVAEALAGESPGRVLRIAEAKIIEADPAGHAARLEEELRKRFVRCAPSDEHGLRMFYARIEAGDAAWLDAVIDRVADILADRPDLTPDLPAEPTRDELRAIASAGSRTPTSSSTSSRAPTRTAPSQTTPTSTATSTSTTPQPPCRVLDALGRRCPSTSTCTRPPSRESPPWPGSRSSARCCATRYAASSAMRMWTSTR